MRSTRSFGGAVWPVPNQEKNLGSAVPARAQAAGQRRELSEEILYALKCVTNDFSMYGRCGWLGRSTAKASAKDRFCDLQLLTAGSQAAAKLVVVSFMHFFLRKLALRRDVPSGSCCR